MLRIQATFPDGCTADILCDLESFDATRMPTDEMWTIEHIDFPAETDLDEWFVSAD